MPVRARSARRRTTAPDPNQGTLFDDFDLQPEPAAVKPPPVPGPAATSPATGPAGRVRANLAALATIRALAGHPASRAQADVLAGWSGWGAVPEVFDTAKAEWQWVRDELAKVLDPAEYAAAARSTLNAHYTDPVIVDAIWQAMYQAGMPTGQRLAPENRYRVLEPGCGSGNFIAAAPHAVTVTGVELDPTTAAIARARCPGHRIVTGSFADTRLPGLFDAVIGNVPFGKITLTDAVHNRVGHSIHNHFIIKALHLTRPGGLVAVVTSRYTLDSENPFARRDMHALADLVAAIRLPGDAHQATAGTRVVTDVLILRRREPGRQPAPAGWLDTVDVELDGHTVPVNRHFVDDPRWCLGTMTAGHGMWRDGNLIVTAAGNLADTLPAALTAAISAAGLTWTPPEAPAPEPEPSPDDLEEGHIVQRGKTFCRVEEAAFVDHPVPRTQTRELAALLVLRDTARAVLTAEVDTDEDSPALTARRDQLRAAYEAYVARFGYLNRSSLRPTGRIDPATGEPAFARVRPPMGGFRHDPGAPLVFALEEYDAEAEQGEGAPILTRRVIARREPPQTADSPADALAVCLDTHGRVDIGAIAALLSVRWVKARELLGDLVFDDPDTGTLLPAAEYLSGDVRVRLLAAETAALDDPLYQPNVAALRAVIPADLTPAEIDARMGAAWIGADVIQRFLRDILDDYSLRVEHPGGQVWSVDGNHYTVRARSTWGTPRYQAPALAQAILEQRRIEVRDQVEKGKYVINLEETAAAAEKAEAMQERFTEWVWEDSDRATRLARQYNDLFNSIVLRSYDDTNLTLPGLSAAFVPHSHQLSAVARIIAEPAVLLAHEVGAGKTAEMIIGAMELRRLGLIRKPCIVVPGHMLDQFAGEWMRLYPLARILITRKEDLRADKRRRLVARVATGDWDGIIMSASTFERIPLSPRALERYLDREAAQMAAWLAVAKAGRSRTVKRLEAAMLRAQERVKKKLAGIKDAGITFEETGIDYLFVDEAHEKKNLRTVSAIQDAAIEGSQRATDLDSKMCWLRDRNGRRVATFATATPIDNSITEIYVMQRYLRPDLLDDRGIDVFDVWAATFGELVTEVELAPEGGSAFRLNTRFARFRNVPELLRLFHVFADVKLAEDLNLPVPAIAERDGKREPSIVETPMSDSLRAYIGDLAERARKIRQRIVRPDEDNMLAVTGDGRRAALDLRIVGLPQHEPGKIADAAAEIHARWLANRDRVYPGPGGDSPIPGSFQFVFMDFSTPKPVWNAYDELRDQLVALGMPARSIRFIHDAKTDQAKAALFAACRAGNVAVLIGSTGKMGVGTNAQDRAIALHHMDAPWRPADIRQRDGRICRPGNLNDEIEILRYITAGSFDGYSWQILTRKAAFIGQVMRGRLDVREIEDIGDTALSYAEVKAIATGNPLLMEQARAQVALTKLQRAERAHNRNQFLLHGTVRDQTHSADGLREEADAAEAAAARRVDVTGDLFTMTVLGDRFGKRADAAAALSGALRSAIEKCPQGGKVQVGTLAGFDVWAHVIIGYQSTLVDVYLDGVPSTRFQMTAKEARDAGSAIRRLEYRLSRLEGVAEESRERAVRCDAEAAKAAEALDAPFPRAAELAAAEAESERIRRALDALARGEATAA